MNKRKRVKKKMNWAIKQDIALNPKKLLTINNYRHNRSIILDNIMYNDMRKKTGFLNDCFFILAKIKKISNDLRNKKKAWRFFLQAFKKQNQPYHEVKNV